MSVLALADRQNKFVWEVMDLTVAEFNLWMAYLEVLKDG